MENVNVEDVKRIQSVYDVPEDVAKMYIEMKDYLDTDKGYDIYYKMEKTIRDNKYNTDILYDAAADFRWDGTLTEEFNKRAVKDGRSDLICD